MFLMIVLYVYDFFFISNKQETIIKNFGSPPKPIKLISCALGTPFRAKRKYQVQSCCRHRALVKFLAME